MKQRGLLTYSLAKNTAKKSSSKVKNKTKATKLANMETTMSINNNKKNKTAKLNKKKVSSSRLQVPKEIQSCVICLSSESPEMSKICDNERCSGRVCTDGVCHYRLSKYIDENEICCSCRGGNGKVDVLSL